MVFVLSGTAAGAAAGALLGWAGEQIAEEVRVVTASVLGVAAVGMGVVELRGRRASALQCDRETPRAWMRRGAVAWAACNGAALGIGATSRLGFALWYVLPATALLYADPLLGAIVFGAYGLVRTLSAYGFVLLARAKGDYEHAVDAVLALRGPVRAVCAWQMVALGIMGCVVVGL